MAKLEINPLGAFQVQLNGAPVTAFESIKVQPCWHTWLPSIPALITVKTWLRFCGPIGPKNLP
jgi:hypothetical protein